MVQLSERMQAVANLVSTGCTVCDVGCDHGYLPIYLVEHKKAKRAIAMDVAEGPLSAARENIAKAELEAKIQTRLSDGLDALEYLEANSLVIAGMGGGLVQHILSANLDKAKQIAELILQPQSELYEVRKFLADHGFQVFAEDMVLEGGKFYPMMKVSFVGELLEAAQPTEAGLYFGQKLIEEKHPVLKEYLLREKRITGEVLAQLRAQEMTEAIAERLAEKEHYAGLVNEVLQLF